MLNGTSGERVKLLNIVMQLRKACNHPYLFDGVEDKTLDPFGDHLCTHSGKLMLLEKLLPRLQQQVRPQQPPSWRTMYRSRGHSNRSVLIHPVGLCRRTRVC